MRRGQSGDLGQRLAHPFDLPRLHVAPADYQIHGPRNAFEPLEQLDDLPPASFRISLDRGGSFTHSDRVGLRSLILHDLENVFCNWYPQFHARAA
jgi:hypothetical protein